MPSKPTHHAAALPAIAAALAFFASASPARAQSLDDLLNIPVKPGAPATPDRPADAPAPPKTDALPLNPEVKKHLSEKEVSDLYRSAIDDMRVAAERLSDQRDAGAQTQNAQQEALSKLARLISDLESRQQSGGSSSSSSQSQDQQQQQQQGDTGSQQNSGKPGGQSGSGKGSGKEQPGREGKKGDEPGDKTDGGKPDKGKAPPGGREASTGADNAAGGIAGGTPTTPLEEAKSNWGNLPPRVRDELLEGIGEKFSPVYREMTEAYYRRLGEDRK